MTIGLTILRRRISVVAAMVVAFSSFTCAAGAGPATIPIAPPPPQYVCARAPEPPNIDGKLDDPAWNAAAWTGEFVDIVRGGKVKLATRAKLMWDDSNLYIAAELVEPHLRAKIDKRDEWVFHENAFEIFIDPDGDNLDYAEIQLNAINTICDVRMDKPYRDNGKPNMFWDVHDMRTSVHLDGTLNDSSDEDKGWTLELAIPWHALSDMRGGHEGPPANGEQWRMNFARVEYPPKFDHGQYHGTGGGEYSCWSPQGRVELHAPERWGFVQFSTDARAEFKVDKATNAVRDMLMRIYQAQHEYRRFHAQWSERFSELEPLIGATPDNVAETTVLTTPQGWQANASVRTEAGLQTWHVRQDSKLWHD